jgi:uncharacterized membrane protein YadS
MEMEKRKFIRNTEDWWALWIGLGVFLLSLGPLVGKDLLGFGVATSMWLSLGKALAPVSKAYAGLSGLGALLLTYLFMLLIMSVGAKALKFNLKEFVIGFTVIFWVSYACWLIGNWAYIAATPNQRAAVKLSWSLGLTGEAGFIVALLVGLILGNFFPSVTAFLKEATRPEWYIKTAIVILGASLGVQAAGATGLAKAVMFRGFAAIVEAYLIYWALVYLVSRKLFKFSREWSAPLASGISICGVSAAIATGAAIKTRPVVPIMVSSLVVIFAVVELLLLPFLAQTFLYNQPLVAGAWMGLAVKTDGAAVASGAITDALIRAKALAATGVNYKEGWVLMTATTVKVFIDIFIGIWAFVLALIWVYAIEKKAGKSVAIGEIWERFPKFVLGYFVTFLAMLGLALQLPSLLGAARVTTAESNIFRVLFFVMTFFTIGLVSNFKKLWEEGIGKLALVYVVCLFGFIIWIGLVISWVFFHGILPPTA